MSPRPPYQLVNTYIGLSLPAMMFADFPESVEWASNTFKKKSEFHSTICKGEEVFTTASLEQQTGEPKLLALFNSLVEQAPILLESFLDDFRFAQEEEKKSIVVRCKLSNLGTFFDELNATFKINIPMQPAHVTLYTLEGKPGIHINSDEKMESLERVRLPELEAALSKIQKTT